jgi:multimeric flavodoxin WrbA
VLAADGLMVASPIFFYTVSAHLKLFMDRCQSLWVRKYWIDQTPFDQKRFKRKGLFLSAGATQGKRLFDGTLLTMRYFFDVFDAELHDTLLYRGLDFQGDAQKHPDYLSEAREAGNAFVKALKRD